MIRSLLFVLAGCPAGPTTSHTGTDPSDTGTDPSCPVAPLAYPASCVETTAVIDVGTSYYEPVVVQGSGMVLEAGSDLPPVDGSTPMIGFGACAADHTHQVRLLDEGGETWTFGWDIEGDVDDDSLAAIEDGETLAFYATWAFFGYSSGGAVVLSDDAGPLFLLELGYTTLDDVQRGFTVTRADGACITTVGGDEKEFYELTFTWTDGSGDLWPGDSVTVPYPGRAVEVVLGDSSWLTGCADGCGSQWWAGVPEGP